MNEEDYKVLCICGHMLEDHHLSYFMDGSGRVWAEECEFYGTNEDGGMMPNPVIRDAWMDHCYKFTPVKEIVHE